MIRALFGLSFISVDGVKTFGRRAEKTLGERGCGSLREKRNP